MYNKLVLRKDKQNDEYGFLSKTFAVVPKAKEQQYELLAQFYA